MAQTAQDVAGQAQEKASQATDQARTKVREQVDQRSTQVGEQIGSSASDARSVADELRKQGKDSPARLADQAADRAERVGSWLQESDGDRILRDVEDFGRRNPWAAAACGLAVGFTVSRLLKASSSRRYQSSFEDSSTRQQPNGEPTGQLPGEVGIGATVETGGS